MGDTQAVSAAAAVPAAMEMPPRRAGRISQLQNQVDRLKDSLRVAVIYGGDKSVDGSVINQAPNTRSWKSYRQVAEDIGAALERLGFRHVFLTSDDMRLGTFLRANDIHMGWLNTAGVQGYNPMCHAASMLEMAGVPYIGHDPLAVGVLDNKHTFKRELTCLSIPTAPFMTWHMSRGHFRPKVNSRFARTFKDHWGPFVVKPVSGRASLHVHVVDEVSDLPDVVAAVFEATRNHVLIEAYLPGQEYCIAVSGPVRASGGRLERLSEPFAFSAVERILSPDEAIFTSMDQRPISGARFRLLEVSADGQILSELGEMARNVFTEMTLESIIRLDVRADSDGKLFVLEANPKPDLKAPTAEVTSLVSAGLANEHMSYDDLILGLFADRIDLLFSQRRGAVTHLMGLAGA